MGLTVGDAVVAITAHLPRPRTRSGGGRSAPARACPAPGLALRLSRVLFEHPLDEPDVHRLGIEAFAHAVLTRSAPHCFTSRGACRPGASWSTAAGRRAACRRRCRRRRFRLRPRGAGGRCRASRTRSSPTARSVASVWRLPGPTRGWTLTISPREDTLTGLESARADTCWPISSPGTEYNGLAYLDVAVPLHLGRRVGRPCTGIPTTSRHQCSVRRRASARSVNASSAKRLPRTLGTVRSTRGLSVGVRTLAASMTNPRAWEYSAKASVKRGSYAPASMTIGDMLSGMTTLKTPAKNAQAASKPSMTASVVWRNVNHTKQWRL